MRSQAANLFTSLAQTEAGSCICLYIDVVLCSKLLTEVVKQHFIKVSATQISVPVVREHTQLPLLEGHDCDL